MVELYEVKTSTGRSDVYSAIGQLMVHGPPHCARVIVLPKRERLAEDLRRALERHHIGLLRFTLNSEKAKVSGDIASR